MELLQKRVGPVGNVNETFSFFEINNVIQFTILKWLLNIYQLVQLSLILEHFIYQKRNPGLPLAVIHHSQRGSRTYLMRILFPPD